MKSTPITLSIILALGLSSCGKKEETAAAPSPAALPAGETETIELKFPNAMFVGTPTPAKLPNLEVPNKDNVVKSIVVPKGTTNLALKKKVTSSDPAPIIGDVELITDGDADGSDGCYVELAPGSQWVQIDLEKESELHNIVVWHFHKAAVAYVDVIVEVSNDPEFTKDVVTLYNSDHDNTQGKGAGKDMAYIETNHGRVIKANGTKARYVRLSSAGSTASELNHYCEVSVYGK
jgi:hypothetical protein